MRESAGVGVGAYCVALAVVLQELLFCTGSQVLQ